VIVKTRTTSQTETGFVGPCSLLRRLAAMIYDGLLVIALLMVAAAAAVVPAGLLFLPEGADFPASDPFFRLYLIVVWWAYFAVSWRQGGQTVGMRAWRIQLLADQGGPIGWAASAGRFLMAFVSAAAVGLGYLWSLFEPERRCWHDIASGSRLMVQPKKQRPKNG
jgi:uncharacterized RDD family membrane protein YckC